MIDRTRTFAIVNSTKTRSVEPPDALIMADKSDVGYLLGGMSVRYFLALLLVAGLATSAFFIMHSLLSLNEKSGTVVNVSGRQRMLSQRGALFSLRLVTAGDEIEKAQVREKLQGVADLMMKSHLGLINGSEELGLPLSYPHKINPIKSHRNSHLSP